MGFKIILVGHMALIIPIEEETIPAEMTVDNSVMLAVGVGYIAEGIPMTSQVRRNKGLTPVICIHVPVTLYMSKVQDFLCLV